MAICGDVTARDKAVFMLNWGGGTANNLIAPNVTGAARAVNRDAPVTVAVNGCAAGRAGRDTGAPTLGAVFH